MKQKNYLYPYMFIFLLMLQANLFAQHSAYLEEGIKLFENQNYNDARNFFTDILEEDRKNPIAAFYMGRIYFIEKDFNKAAKWLDKAIDIDTTNSSYYYWLGKTYEGKLEKANILNLVSIYSKMKSNFKKAIEIDPGHIEARYELAKAYNNASPVIGGSKKKARQQLKELMKISPLKGYDLAGYFYWYDDKWDLAIQEYQKFVAVDSSNPEVQYQLGVCYYKTEELEKAFDCAERAIEINSNFDAAHYLLGRIYEKSGKNDLAKMEYEMALKLNPDKDRYKNALKNLQ